MEKNLVAAGNTTCFALLGTDLIVDSEGNIQVCEVNSHPALGWGTMSKVPSPVFSDLVDQTLDVLLGGASEGSEFKTML